MYGQGNHAIGFGESPNRPVLPPYQQRPQTPPPPPPQFRPPGTSPHVPPYVSQFGPSAYQHGHVTADTIHAGPSAGGANASQSYLRPPLLPLIHGSAHMSLVYPNAQHSLQYHSPARIQNVHHISPSVPLPLPRPPPEMLQPPQNHRVPNPPPPPSQGQMYSNVVHQPPQPGGIQGFQHIPLPPPPPSNSGPFAVATYGALENAADEDPHLPFQAPPPLPPPPPSSPPPIPPSPPPSYYTPAVASSDMLLSLDTGPSSSSLKSGPPNFVDESLPHIQFRDNEPLHDSYLSRKGESSSEVSAQDGGCSLLKGNVMLDFPPPPRKPASEKLVQKIEVLCHYIAKNGPEFEDMARQNESKNSEFEFLFGGEPGSEAAIAHEYFVWMKRKCMLACKNLVGQGNTPLRPLRPESPNKPYRLMAAAKSGSPADSDMEMEDDITQSDKDPEVSQSTEVLNHEYDFIPNEFNVEEQLHMPQSSAECGLSKDVSPEKELGERGKGQTLQHDITIANSDGAAEYPEEILFTSVADGPSVADAPSTDGDLAVVEPTSSAGNHAFFIKGGSPFRLLQEYASDDVYEDDDDTQLGDVCSAKLSPPISTDFKSSHVNMESNLELDVVSNSHCKSGRGVELEKLSELNESHMHKDSHVEIKETVATLSRSKGLHEYTDNNHASSQKNDDLGGAWKNVVSENAKSQKALNPLKVDEFGRLVKPNETDSDSDDSRRAGRLGKRGRNRSRSLSPSDMRRRRRSPHRRGEKRSQSRSRSPRKRRSRSRSPMFRRAGEFSGNNTRQRKSQTSVCFNFLEGKCYRGASCKYHHDSDRADGTRNERRKHKDLEAPSFSKNSHIHEKTKKIPLKISDYNDEVKLQGKLPYEDTTGGSSGATDGGNIDGKREDSVINAPESVGFDESCKSTDSTQRAAEITSTTSPNKLLINETSKLISSSHVTSCSSQPILSEKFPSGTMATKELSPPCSSAADLPYPPPSLPLPPPQLPQGVNAPDKPHPTRDHNLSSRTASSPYSSEDIFPHYMLPNQQSHFTLPTNSSWTLTQPLPPLPLHPYDSIISAGNMAPGTYSQCPPIYLPPKNESGAQDFFRSYPSDLPTHCQVGEFQQRVYHSMQQPHLPVLLGENGSFNPLPLGSLPRQQFGGPSSLGEDRLTHISEQKSSFSRANIHSQQTHFEGALPANKVHSFPGEHFPPGEILLSSHKQQQLSYSVQQRSTDDSLLGLPGKMVSSSSIHMADYVDKSQLSRLPGSKLSSYHNNPYASTFEQPLNSKFSYDAFRNEKFIPYGSKHDASFSLKHVTADGDGVAVVGSRQTSSSPNSSGAVKLMLSRSGNDQYDPLFDSIEPSSNSFKKIEHAKRQESTNDSDILVRLSGSNKPLDVAENNKKREAGVVAPTTSLDNDEFGETADAEVGAVENDSPSNSIDVENTNEGEIEIDQIKSVGKSGKSKKSKDSRSTKLFKIAIADFVKEVLKPSWRQGNMSKEAFKTIVKKTVDKVSGAMKGHQMPKSQARINHYIDSSQWKLTKLVMGYVDKYVKL